jgi:hypothetical protein
MSHYAGRAPAPLEDEGKIAKVVSRKLQCSLHGGNKEALARRRRRRKPDSSLPDPEADLVLGRELISPL